MATPARRWWQREEQCKIYRFPTGEALTQLSQLDLARDEVQITELENGDVIVDGIQLFKIGKGFRQGKHSPEFDYTDKDARQTVENFQRDLTMGGHEVFLTIGHPDRLDEAPAVAWVKALEHRAGEGVFGTIKILKDMVKRIRSDEFRYFSPTFSKAATDEHGKSIGTKMFSGAILNFPHWKGMTPNFGVLALSELYEDKDNMDEKQFAEMLAKALGTDAFKTQLSGIVGAAVDTKLGTSLTELRQLITDNKGATPPTPPAKGADGTIALSAHPEYIRLQQELNDVKAANNSRDMRDLLRAGARKGVFTKAQLGTSFKLSEDFDAMAVAKGIFGDDATLGTVRRFIATASPVIDLSERISGDADVGHGESTTSRGSGSKVNWNDPTDPTVIKCAQDVGCTPAEFIRRSAGDQAEDVLTGTGN